MIYEATALLNRAHLAMADASIQIPPLGIPVVVLLPYGKVALGKVAQALMHGANALALVRDLCETDWYCQ